MKVPENLRVPLVIPETQKKHMEITEMSPMDFVELIWLMPQRIFHQMLT